MIDVGSCAYIPRKRPQCYSIKHAQYWFAARSHPARARSEPIDRCLVQRPRAKGEVLIGTASYQIACSRPNARTTQCPSSRSILKSTRCTTSPFALTFLRTFATSTRLFWSSKSNADAESPSVACPPSSHLLTVSRRRLRSRQRHRPLSHPSVPILRPRQSLRSRQPLRRLRKRYPRSWSIALVLALALCQKPVKTTVCMAHWDRRSSSAYHRQTSKMRQPRQSR